MTWVRSVVKTHDLADADTLEVGSYDENGSVREYFTGNYTGVDMREGQSVDMVVNAHDLPFEDESFDVVVCTEMIEHDDRFWVSLDQMGRVLKPGGYLILTSRGNGFPLHAYPDDFYRFMPSAAPVLLAVAGCEVISAMEDPQDPGFFALGRKV